MVLLELHSDPYAVYTHPFSVSTVLGPTNRDEPAFSVPHT